MTRAKTKEALPLERVIGSLGVPASGPLLVATAGIHGNEPAGVQALQRVFAELEAREEPIQGRFVGLAGNLGALALGQRYVDTDLNREWTAARVRELLAADPAGDHSEAREQRAILEHFEREIAAAGDRAVRLIDLHSTSGSGPPFAILDEGGPARGFAESLGVPMLFGLHENVAGTLLDYFADRGQAGLVLEGGQNEDPGTVANHEAAVWLALDALGMLREPSPSRVAAHRARLRAAAAGLPDRVRIRLRYAIDPGEAFRMEPGYTNFQRVRRGELLARSGPRPQDEIRSPLDAVLIMPRYQGQGADGFFLGFAEHGARTISVA